MRRNSLWNIMRLWDTTKITNTNRDLSENYASAVCTEDGMREWFSNLGLFFKNLPASMRIKHIHS